MKNILVPVDFSPTSSHALDFAVDFNSRIGARIILLHVLEYPNYDLTLAQEEQAENATGFFTEKLIKVIEARLGEWSARVRAVGQEVSLNIKYGNPYQNISKEIVNEKADWIIMGSKGASGLREILLGSNAERVIRYSDCPVIIIKGATGISTIKSIVFASDLSEEQDWMAYHAKVIQGLLGLEMHILKIRTTRKFLGEQTIQNQLKAFADRNHFKNSTVNSFKAKRISDGILEFSNKVNAGLVIIGTHGRTAASRSFDGSKAEALVNHSKIPILVFKIGSETKQDATKIVAV